MDEGGPTHLDLFSGIGGFALAAQWAGFRTIAFVEREPFCQKILSQHWPTVPCYSDICQFGGAPFRGVDLLTGGFPCQPFSVAGEQRGKADDRYLWPEMFRVIRTTKPRWIIGENVAGLDGLGLDDCISDLEASGYEVAPPLEIPAASLGALHVRNRLWIIANSDPDSVRSRGEWTAPVGAWCKQQFTGLVQDQLRVSLPAGKSGGVSDGIPNRTHRLKGLGNAIVPQVAYQIIKEIRRLL